MVINPAIEKQRIQGDMGHVGIGNMGWDGERKGMSGSGVTYSSENDTTI